MPARRVAYVSHSSSLGGESVLLRLLSSLDRTRTDALAVFPSEGPLAAAVADLGIPIRITPLAWWIPATHWSAGEFRTQLEGLEGRAAALAELLRAERAELVHTNVIVTLEGALAAASLGLPHVWHSRGLFDDRFPPPYFDDIGFLLGTVDALTDAVACVSRAVLRQTAEYCREARLRVIHDGFDAGVFLAQPVESDAAFRSRFDLPPTARLAATVGGIQRRKGLADLVEAAAVLAPAHADVVFLVAGAETDPDFAAAMRSRIHALGLDRRFRFLGFQKNVRSVLASSDLLVHPSHSEGFGAVLLEAMAAGKPVVATRCGGPEEIVQDGQTGYLVPVGDPPALAAAMDAVLSDPAAAKEMARQAQIGLAEFSLAAAAHGTQDLDDEVAGASDGDGGRRRKALAERLPEILGRARRAGSPTAG